jgi:phosphatidate cytidylyltransferase
MPSLSELQTRIISAIILASATLVIFWWSAESFALLCAIAALILLKEWRALTRHRHPLFLPLGVVYIGAACVSLIYLRYEHMAILLAVFVIVWTGDIAAYLVGRRFGRHKVAPSISPGKSWEGFVAAILASAYVASVLGNIAPLSHAAWGALLAILGLGGDLFESALKRRAGVKDSGTLIPGHGGLFDRVDALLPCVIVAAITLYIH